MAARLVKPMALDLVETPRAAWLKRTHYLALSIAGSVLCTTAQIKFAEVQLLELIFAFDLLVIGAWFVLHPAPIKIFRPFWDVAMRWTIFSVFALLLAVYSLRQDFFPGTVGPLKMPFIVTVSRIGELFLDVFFMLYLAEAYRHDERLRRFAALTYYWVGIAGAIYALVSEVALFANVKLGGADKNFRAVGFNNEGGPYGVYLLTVIFMVTVLRSQHWIGRRAAIASYILFGVSLAGSQSKSALFEVVALCVLIPALRLRGRKLAITIVAVCMAFAVVYVALDIPAMYQKYKNLADQYQAISVQRPNDNNFVAGRISGLFIAPKMIAAHPLAGIGLGNYPILRDDPAYRQGTPIVALSLDSPSMGPIDYLVDLGLPLFLYFTWVEIAPAFILVRLRKNSGLICLALMQPVSNWFGAHLNLTYPWLAASIALGIAYATNESGMIRKLPLGLRQSKLHSLEATP
jgi:hypothetical protein